MHCAPLTEWTHRERGGGDINRRYQRFRRSHGRSVSYCISQVVSFDEKDAELFSCMLSSGVNCGRTLAALTELTGSGRHAKMALMLGEASALIKTASSLAAASEAALLSLLSTHLFARPILQEQRKQQYGRVGCEQRESPADGESPANGESSTDGGAAAEAAVEAAPCACSQLALHGLLHGASLLVRIVTALPDGAARLARYGSALVRALLPITSEACFAFVRAIVRDLLAMLVPLETLHYLTDLQQLRNTEAFLQLVPPRLGGAARNQKLVALMSESLAQLDRMGRDSSRQRHVVLYYTGGTCRVGADASGAEAADATPGDLTVLIRLLHSLSNDRHVSLQVQMLKLLRSLAWTCFPGASVPLCGPDGTPQQLGTTSLVQQLTVQLLDMDERFLEEWLRANVLPAAGPRDHARPAARAVGPYPSGSGVSAGSRSRGVQASAASDDTFGVWERISELFKALVDAPSSSPAHSAAQSELGDRLWRMLRDMLWPALMTQSSCSAGLLSLLRSLAATRARLPELARLTLELLRRAQTELVPNAENVQSVGVLLELLMELLRACEGTKAARPTALPDATSESAEDASASDEESEMEVSIAEGPAEHADPRQRSLLACQVCTFAVTGSTFTEQHWYYCYTCGLTQSEGCCTVCIKVCHAGHVVSYSRRSRFFCDCGAGAGAVRGLQCAALTPRRSGCGDVTCSSSSSADGPAGHADTNT